MVSKNVELLFAFAPLCAGPRQTFRSFIRERQGRRSLNLGAGSLDGIERKEKFSALAGGLKKGNLARSFETMNRRLRKAGAGDELSDIEVSTICKYFAHPCSA